MRKNSIIFDKPAFHQTRIGRTVIGGAAAILTAGASYWTLMSEPESKIAKAPAAASTVTTSAQVSPFAPVTAASAVMATPRASAVEPDAPRYDIIATRPSEAPPPPSNQPYVALYPDVQSALQQFQREDITCAVQRYTHRPTADGLVTAVQSPVGAISRENVVDGCATNKMLAAFGNAADVTLARRMNDLPSLQDAEDKIFPPVLMQVLALPKTSDGMISPVGQLTLVCEQEGSIRRNDIRYKCRLAPS